MYSSASGAGVANVDITFGHVACATLQFHRSCAILFSITGTGDWYMIAHQQQECSP
jgi:hypothetical protein